MKSSDGFTIIELLIATVFFSLLLLVTSAVIIGISDSYIKGQVQGITQQSARDIMGDISQDIKFNNNLSINLWSPAKFSGKNVYYFCVGTDVYVYHYDLALSPNTATGQYSEWGLLRYTGSCPATTPVVSVSGQIAGVQNETELLADNERLGYLYIPPPTQPIPNENVYTISIEIAYGVDNSLLNDSALNGAFVNAANNPPQTYQYKYACQSGSDSNYCAVSALTEVSEPRINE